MDEPIGHYHPPTLDEAREWASSFPDLPASAFACRYPGRYNEAAQLARQAIAETYRDG